MCRTSTIPVSSCSWPIGRCTATQRGENCSRSCSSVRMKSARSRSSMLTKNIRARLSCSARSQIAAGLHLDPHHGADGDQRALDDAQRGDHVALEARLAGRVDQVDLVALPVDVARRGLDRHGPAVLVLVPVRDGRALLDAAEPVDGARLEQHRLDERGLPRPPVSGDGDVADLARLERGHAKRSSCGRGG